MRRTSNYVRTICEIGMFAAIGFVLDELQGILSKGLFPLGGSIGFAMIAVIVVGFRRGWLPAILTGLIMGCLDIATSAYIVHPAQLLLDYIFPYALVGIPCVLKYFFDRTDSKANKIMWLCSAIIIGGLLKFVSHFLSGVIFFADPNGFAWGLTSMNPFLYSFIYNIAFIGPSIILTGAISVVMFLSAPIIFSPKDAETKTANKKDVYGITSSIIYIAGGLFSFIWFLIDYIKSFEFYKEIDEAGNVIASGYDFNPDSMIIFVLGAFFVVLGILSLIKIKKSRYSQLFATSVGLTIVSSSFIYCLSRLIRMYVKHKSPTIYWIWFAIGLFTIGVFVGLVLYFYNIKKHRAVQNQTDDASIENSEEELD